MLHKSRDAADAVLNMKALPAAQLPGCGGGGGGQGGGQSEGEAGLLASAWGSQLNLRPKICLLRLEESREGNGAEARARQIQLTLSSPPHTNTHTHTHSPERSQSPTDAIRTQEESVSRRLHPSSDTHQLIPAHACLLWMPPSAQVRTGVHHPLPLSSTTAISTGDSQQA